MYIAYQAVYMVLQSMMGNQAGVTCGHPPSTTHDAARSAQVIKIAACILSSVWECITAMCELDSD